MECVIYMGAEDVRRQALNVFRIEMLGGKVCKFFDLKTSTNRRSSPGDPGPLGVVHPQGRR